jgi:hypothetical protein
MVRTGGVARWAPENKGECAGGVSARVVRGGAVVFDRSSSWLDISDLYFVTYLAGPPNDQRGRLGSWI